MNANNIHPTATRPEPTFMDPFSAQTQEAFTFMLRAADAGNPQLAARLRADGIETVLFGRDGCLDSLGLVTFIVAIETEIEDTRGIAILLADERAMSMTHSPFRTAGRLADYVARRLAEEDCAQQKAPPPEPRG